ncbi:MAG: 2-deoxyribose-5-phosphate aldolase, partial [Propionibacteriaceae bacterium]|nr:2-deoxyribose-5-phosphate aldolase [Propionibacteriaceae bacterium]
MALSRDAVAQMCDHTLLKPESTPADVAALVDQGVTLGVYSVCVSPSQLPLDARGLKVAVVAGFPSGAHQTEVKAAEAA